MKQAVNLRYVGAEPTLSAKRGSGTELPFGFHKPRDMQVRLLHCATGF